MSMPVRNPRANSATNLRALRKLIHHTNRFGQVLVLLLRAGCAIAAAGYLGAYAWVVWNRVRYPFDLEWMEGAMVDHVRFLLSHGNLYVPPSLEFVPFVYNPFYYVVSAGVSLFTGEGYVALRLVSIVASLACVGLIGLIVCRETRRRELGILSGGLFIATYALSGGWLDIARVDSLYLAFCLGAIALVRFAPRNAHLVAAAVCVWLAFETKQSGVGIVMPLGLYLMMFEGWRRTLWFVLPCGALVGGSILILNVVSGGWYWFYTFSLTGQLASHYGRSVWKTELFGNFPLALALVFYYFAGGRSPSRIKAKVFYGIVAVTLFAIAVAVRAHAGSWLNDNMTAHAALAILSGLGAGALLRAAHQRHQRGAEVLVYGALLAQFLLLAYDPRPWVPTHADRQEGERLEAMVRASPGEVLLTHRGYLTRREGKGSFAHQMAVYNMLMIPDDRLGARTKLTSEFIQALQAKRFSLILTDWDDFPFTEELKQSYDPVPPAYIADPKAFWCPTGARLKPVFAYVPK
jgi:hypothetical protein